MKKRTKNNFKFFLFIFICCLVAFGGAMLFNGKDDSFARIIGSFKEDEFVDTYNGFYSYSEDLNGSKTVFEACTLSKINNYILIINEDFYTYRSSCIGTFRFEKGKVKDLEIGENKERKSYYVKYKDNVYYRDYSVTTLEVGNSAKDKNYKLPLKHYQLLFKESQYPDAYYDLIFKEIDGLSSDIYITFKHIEGESFEVILYGEERTSMYNYIFKDFDSMPEFYPYGAYLVVIEKDETDDKYANRLMVFSETGMVYNLEEKLPIIVDGDQLDLNDSIYVDFDEVDRDFRVIISNTKKMCFDDTKEEGISFYEFKIDYNYSSKAFEKPEFVTKGKKGDSCVYINEIIGG